MVRLSSCVRRALVLALLTVLVACADAADSRSSWVHGVLLDADRDLIERDPARVAEKYDKMSDSLYLFFRGTAAVWWADVTGVGAWALPTSSASVGTTRVPIVGDPHVENIGTFRTGDGEIIVSYNDFDAGTFGPAHIDVRRLALSFRVVAHDAAPDDRGAALGEQLAEAIGEAYVDEIRRLARGGAPLEVTGEAGFGTIIDDVAERAQEDWDIREELEEYTVLEGGQREMFFGDIEPPEEGYPSDSTVRLTRAERDLVSHLVDAYVLTVANPDAFSEGFFDVLGVSRRLGAGVGSYPVERYYVLVAGETESPDDDRLLEFKEIRDPPRIDGLAPLLGRRWEDNAQRTVWFQRRFSARSDADVLLGWASVGPVGFKIRERTKAQKSLGADRIAARVRSGRWSAAEVVEVAETAARLLANGHALAPAADGAPALDALANALGDAAAFGEETARFVRLYWPVFLADYQAFVEALEDDPRVGIR